MDDNLDIRFNTPTTPSLSDGGSKYKNKNRNRKKSRCSECRKSFTSRKALFGHMRCHPERDWRGARPSSSYSWSSRSSNITTTAAAINKYYSSTSSGSEDTSSSTPLSTAFKWGVTAKRGRMSIVGMTKQQPTPNSSTYVYQQSPTMLLEEAAEKFSKWKELEENTQVTDKKQQKIDHESAERCEDGHISDSTLKKKVKGVDEVGVVNSVSGSGFYGKLFYKYVNKEEVETKHTEKPREYAARRAITPVVDQTFKMLTREGEFKCDICNRCFTSYQALGGHKSSHGKHLGTDPNLQLSDIVLNTHQCKICEKSFPTGQALGGHMRLHRVAPALQAHSAPESGLNSDLCQLAPDMEEELRRNQLTLSLF